MSKRKSGHPPSSWVACVEVAESAGVTSEAVADWAKRTDRHRIKKFGMTNYMNPHLADEYLTLHPAPRAITPPDGWLGTNDIIKRIGCDRNWYKRRAYRDDLRTLMHRKTLYMHPEDVERLRLEYGNLRPLPGWVSVRDVHRWSGRSRSRLDRWITREDVQVRAFMNPSTRHMGHYILKRDADAFLAPELERAA